jgi:hypothetical protein
MNEQIWELKRQAMLFAQEKCDGQTTDMHGNLRSNIWTEKFAELIVRECARVYWNIDDGEIHSEYVKALKEHFRIEK